ncbi:MAG: TetR/AcrR family transcriptional regulator [Ruminiclostridium sp.]|nr:TetR/AcrR family transcriptional regulator [Ruminiclostridium sp.]
MNDYTAGKAFKEKKALRIMSAGFGLFAERGIEQVTLQEISDECGVGRTTTFRYFPTKTELVVAIGVWKWKEFIELHNSVLPAEEMEKMTGAEYLRFFLDGFLLLYREHKDILRFNYNFNSFLACQKGTPEQKLPYTRMIDVLGVQFHEVYERGQRDGTINADIPETTMFSSIFHIMLAAVTRYAVGLAVIIDSDPEQELVMLADMMLTRFTKGDIGMQPGALPGG